MLFMQLNTTQQSKKQIPDTCIMDGYVCVRYSQVPQARWLKQQKFIFLQFWRLDIQDQGVGRLVSPEAFFLACRQEDIVFCSHRAFPLCVHHQCLFFFLPVTSSVGLGPTLMSSFSLNYLSTGLISKYSHSEG